MRIIVNEKESNVRVTSTILERDLNNPDIFLLYHCWRCGNPLFQFSGNVVMIAPGVTEVQPRSIPFIQSCRVCKTRHLINSVM